MVLDLSHDEREELAKLRYILETHPGKADALIAENIKLRHFASAVRKHRRYQHAIVQHLLDELPRAGDAKAWESLVADSREEVPGS